MSLGDTQSRVGALVIYPVKYAQPKGQYHITNNTPLLCTYQTGRCSLEFWYIVAINTTPGTLNHRAHLQAKNKNNKSVTSLP